jgi:hypothetical protein
LMDIFKIEIGSHKLFAWGWLILLVSASWVARITEVSHCRLARTSLRTLKGFHVSYSYCSLKLRNFENTCLFIKTLILKKFRISES